MAETRRGWLSKRGRLVKSWKDRYFVLKDGALVYYESEDSVVPKGQMSLFGAAVVFVEPPKIDRANCIEVSTPGRNLYVSHASRDELKEWALSIQRAAIAASGGPIQLQSQRLMGPGMEADAEQLAASFEAAMDVKTPAENDGAAVPAPVLAASEEAPQETEKERKKRLKKEKKEKKKAKKQAKKEKKAAEAAEAIIAAEALRRAEEKATESATTEDEPAEETKKERKARRKAEKKAKKKSAKDSDSSSSSESSSESSSSESSSESSSDDDVDEVVNVGKSVKVEFTEAEIKQNMSLLAAEFQANQTAFDGMKQRAKALKKQFGKWDVSQVKLRKTLKGHVKFVNVVAKNQFDEKKLGFVGSGGDDTTVRLWNNHTLKPVHVFEGHDDVIKSMVFGTNYLITGADDGCIKVWNVGTKKCAKTFHSSAGKPVDDLALSDNERVLISASANVIQAWDLKEMKCVANLDTQHDGKITCIALAGQMLFTGSEDKTVKAWDMTTLANTCTLEGHKNWVFCMAVTHEKLYTGSEDIKVWDISSARKGKAKNNATVSHPHDAPSVQSMGVCEDGSYMVTVSIDGSVKIWELELKGRSKPLIALENKTKFIFSVAVVLSKSGDNLRRRIFTADRNSVVKVWE